MIPLPLVIMAGGKSSRMGSDKALLPFGDFPTLTQYQLARWRGCFSFLHVNCKYKEKFDFEASFIEDIPTYPKSSPLIALMSILKYFNAPVAVLSVDTPFVTAEIFETLYQNFSPNTQAIIATSPFGTHPLCGFYTPSLIPTIEKMLENDNHKIGYLLQNAQTVYVNFTDDAPFFNLNYPHEYTQAKELL